MPALGGGSGEDNYVNTITPAIPAPAGPTETGSYTNLVEGGGRGKRLISPLTDAEWPSPPTSDMRQGQRALESTLVDAVACPKRNESGEEQPPPAANVVENSIRNEHGARGGSSSRSSGAGGVTWARQRAEGG